MKNIYRILPLIFLFLFASSGKANDWETLPVFSGGRVMPLHTFAQQAVKDVCGTSKPFVVRDEAVLNELTRIVELFREQERGEQDRMAQELFTPKDEQKTDEHTYQFWLHGNDLDGGFGKQYSIFDIDGGKPQVTSTLPIRGLTRVRAEHLANRIRSLVPAGGRYFTADELLFSWVCEPEVWTFIPIFRVKGNDYADDVLGLDFSQDRRTSQYRVSLYQMSKASRYQQRLADIARRQQLGQVTDTPIRYDVITENLEQQVHIFRELTFHPRRSKPQRMVELLEYAGGLASDQSSYATAFDAWRYLLTIGETPERQSVEPIDPKKEDTFSRILHPTTQRWHDIAQKIQLLIRVYNQSDNYGNIVLPNTDAVERQFEQLLGLLDTSLEESGLLMETLYPGVPFRSAAQLQAADVKGLLPLFLKKENFEDNRRMLMRLVPSYHYAVKKLRYEIEAAYLALYDNGGSLRILPLYSKLALGGFGEGHETFGVPPWASIQMIASAGESFIKRFLDAEYQTLVLSPTPVTAGTSGGERSENGEITGKPKQENNKEDGTGEDEQAPAEKTASEEGSRTNSSETDSTSKEEDNAERKLFDEMFADQKNEEQLIFEEEVQESKYAGIINKVRTDLGLMVSTYGIAGLEYGDSRFDERAKTFQSSARSASVSIERSWTQLVDTKDPFIEELIKKTSYPVLGALLAEYRYTHFAPFFWMFIFGGFAAVLGVVAFILGTIRRGMIIPATFSITSGIYNPDSLDEERADYTNSAEEWFNTAALLMLFLSVLVTFIGGAMRASITGWAPVTNMYETVVFTAFCAGLFGLWYSLYPLLQPVLQIGWLYSAFPSLTATVKILFGKKKTDSSGTEGEMAMRQAAAEFGVPAYTPAGADKTGNTIALFWQSALTLPRLCLMFAVFSGVVILCNGHYAEEHGLWAAASNLLSGSDAVDKIVVFASIVLIVWYVPHFFLMFVPALFVLFQPRFVASELGITAYIKNDLPPVQQRVNRSELSNVFAGETMAGGRLPEINVSGAAWLKIARNGILDRKLLTVTASIVLVLAGLAAYLNTSEFNPAIRPIAAVLRSNFWLTVHVIAIVASYSAAFVAWGMSIIALGSIIFGRYNTADAESGTGRVTLPALGLQFAPIIEKLLKISLFLLIIGTVLGARWADYSWGRFWSWDAKEVWALITIIFYVIVLHGKIAHCYRQIGIMLGGLFASIAVIITWYGINFVFKGSMHSYGSGNTDNATLFLGLFIIANLLWGSLALLRHIAETLGKETKK